MTDTHNTEPVFIVQKVYEYERQYQTQNGTKSYTQRVKAITNKTVLEREFSKKLNTILTHTTTLNKLNRIRNSIIKNKCYGKTNYIKQINKLKIKGEITEETKNLLYDIGKRSYEIAGQIEDSLIMLLEAFNDESKRIEQFNRELDLNDKQL